MSEPSYTPTSQPQPNQNQTPAPVVPLPVKEPDIWSLMPSKSTILQAVMYALGTGMTWALGKFGADVEHIGGWIGVWSLILGVPITAAIGIGICQLKTLQVRRAESRVPGITTRTGPKYSRVIIENNPQTEDPPVVLVTPPPTEADASP